MFFLAIGMYLVTFDLIKKIGVGANFGEGGPEKQLFFTMALHVPFFFVHTLTCSFLLPSLCVPPSSLLGTPFLWQLEGTCPLAACEQHSPTKVQLLNTSMCNNQMYRASVYKLIVV